MVTHVLPRGPTAQPHGFIYLGSIDVRHTTPSIRRLESDVVLGTAGHLREWRCGGCRGRFLASGGFENMYVYNTSGFPTYSVLQSVTSAISYLINHSIIPSTNCVQYVTMHVLILKVALHRISSSFDNRKDIQEAIHWLYVLLVCAPPLRYRSSLDD